MTLICSYLGRPKVEMLRFQWGLFSKSKRSAFFALLHLFLVCLFFPGGGNVQGAKEYHSISQLCSPVASSLPALPALSRSPSKCAAELAQIESVHVSATFVCNCSGQLLHFASICINFASIPCMPSCSLACKSLTAMDSNGHLFHLIWVKQ